MDCFNGAAARCLGAAVRCFNVRCLGAAVRCFNGAAVRESRGSCRTCLSSNDLFVTIALQPFSLQPFSVLFALYERWRVRSTRTEDIGRCQHSESQCLSPEAAKSIYEMRGEVGG